jgi:uncharacterized protein YllA (UPF0747 family)
MKKNILTYLGIAAVLVGWGVTWANQNAKISENRTSVELLNKRMDVVSQQASESEKVIIRIETKVEYIMKAVDEIKTEIKTKKAGGS